MASVSLITMNAPTGFWPAILNFFKGANGTYILAVILVAIVVRFLFSFVDIVNKRATMKNSAITEKMQPEIDAVKKRYGDDASLVQQKTNEIYKKYQYNMMGSCLPMLVMMVLQLAVFLTLWNSLQSVANYNIVNQYQQMKIVYGNVLAINENNLVQDGTISMSEGDTLTVEISINEENETILSVVIVDVNGNRGTYDLKSWTEDISNEKLADLIENYVVVENEESAQEVESESLTAATQTVLQSAIQAAAESAASEYYHDTRESFLWIKNVYKSDTNTSPLFTYSEIESLILSYYSEEEAALEEANSYESTIFTCVVAGVDTDSLGSNGYYILPILAMLSSLLSIWLNNFLTRRKSQTKQKQSWAMYVIMPLIYAIFTFMYTSLFSIYLIVGQLMMVVMAPITSWLVGLWMKHDSKKKQEKDVIEVDYRRKD